MDERLLEMYDWQTLSQENQHEQGQSCELESIAAMEQPAITLDDAKQSPRMHTFESSEEGEHQKKNPMAEECDQTSHSNIQNNSAVHSFDSILFQIEQIVVLRETSPSPGTSQQHETTTK